MLLLSLEKKLLLLMSRCSVGPGQLIHTVSQLRSVLVKRVNLCGHLKRVNLCVGRRLDTLFDADAPALSQPVVHVLYHSSHGRSRRAAHHSRIEHGRLGNGGRVLLNEIPLLSQL